MNKLLAWLILTLLGPFSLVAQEGAYRVFLIGDTGDPYNGKGMAQLQLLRQQIEASGTETAVIFLGDNIYPKGLPEEEHPTYEEAARRIQAQIDIVKGLPVKVFFIPGNHDWKQGRKEGWSHVLNQQRYIQDQLGEVFFPGNACPGPVEVSLTPELTLILMDTQWLLHPWDKPRLEDGCDVINAGDVWVELQDILRRNRDKKILVAGHHPLYTQGIHGGYFPLKTHIFPLTDVEDHLYIPLPVVGSLYPFYRGVLGNIQDTAHPRYKLMIRSLTEVFQSHPNLIYAAGHEHNLQYITKDSVHYVVSGAGCKQTRVRKSSDAAFGEEITGYAQLDFYENGETRLQFWHQEPGGASQPLYTKNLFTHSPRPQADRETWNERLDYSDSSLAVVASDQYDGSGTHTFFFGKNYRKTWRTPVEVPLFDIESEKGGLKIIKKGGGMQTKSLRLEAKDGKQYVLRSVEKYADKAVPEYLRGTLGADIVQDQISASHPYGALVVPPMANAAGVYHTNPKLVYIPQDPRLGIYQKEFAGTLALFEERPDDAWPEQASFGNPEDIDGTLTVLENLMDDNDHSVDQVSVVRARLFDLIIGDWDRHDDQWRWAEYEGAYGKLYRPIPRDRDQTFFVNQGVFPTLASRRWAMPKFQGFKPQTKFVPGFMFNARYFDRSFMNDLEWPVWEREVKKLQKNLTDEVFQKALKQWPDTIYQLNGEEVFRILVSRRDHLLEMARSHYEFLAKEVEVVGSNKKELFIVERLDDDRTKVTVHKLSKNKERIEQIIYERTFYRDETREIRLYGMKDDDDFVLKGDVNKGIRLRIIGGGGEDEVKNDARIKSLCPKTIVYDKPGGMEITGAVKTRDKTSNDPNINLFDRRAVKYDIVAPLIDANYNQDDGIFLGAGIYIQRYKWRKDPYASRHILTANKSFRNESFNVRYKGEWHQVARHLDLFVNADVRSPNFVNNFFGYGNDTENLADNSELDIEDETLITYYRYRYQSIILDLLFSRKLSESVRIFAGPLYQNFKLERTENRFITLPEIIEEIGGERVFDRKSYVGAGVGLEIDSRDNELNPTRGVHWLSQYRYYRTLNDNASSFGGFHTDLAFYFSFRLPTRLVLATRFGGSFVSDGAEFFQSPTLDGWRNMRGLRRGRFTGDQNFYNNTELRLKLFNFRSYLFPGTVGLLAFTDNGRVWADTNASDRWHTTWGGGVWVAPFRLMMLTGTVGATEDGVGFLFKMGFQF